MNPPGADSHEHVSCPGHILIQNNFSAKGVLIKGQALFDIRRKQMYMVDMVHGISLFLADGTQVDRPNVTANR